MALALLVFTALTVAGTWPLVLHLGSSLPGDYGDPLFVTWVMAWVASHLTRVLQGDASAWRTMWDAPIFHPEPNTLAYSEHFVGPAAQALPVYWLTGNPLLAYNLIFLSTFVVSGVGAFLLVRELTGSRLGGLVAGALYAVNDFRTASLAHLHTLSAHWVPLACLGLLLFARTGSRRALAGATLSVVLLNSSSGYYVLYFGPLLAAFALVVLWREQGWRTRRAITAAAIAALAVALIEIPLVRPYLELQRTQQFVRDRAELVSFSYPLELYADRLRQLAPMLALAAASLFGWRAKAAGLRWAIGFFAIAGVLGFWLSLGPEPRLRGAPLGVYGLYDLLYSHVPGYSGLRVAGRFAAVLTFAIAVLGGIGAAMMIRRHRLAGTLLAVALTGAHLSAQWMGPIGLDVPVHAPGVEPAPASLRPSTTLPRIYQFVATTPRDAVLVELPFGDLGYELRYMFFGLRHGRPLLNGYSGYFPPSYRARAALLADPLQAPDEAWRALSPATHVLVHTAAWNDSRRTTIGEWLQSHGARIMATRDEAVLWQLPAPR